MTAQHWTDLLVLGAGPAGASAALAAAEHGMDVVLLDEAADAGGQVFRAPPKSFVVANGKRIDPDFHIGASLRDRLAASRVRKVFERRVWFVAPGFKVSTFGPEGLEFWTAKSVVVASGTYERVVPMPGWTLPGVIGLGAATILLKSQQALPGETTVVAGCGPLVAAVAVGILKAGGKVGAVIDAASPGDWARALPSMAVRPDLLLRGLGWVGRIRLAGVPLLFRHAVVEVRGGDSVTEIMARPVDNQWRPRWDVPARAFQCDALAIGHGLVPAVELTRLLGAEHEFAAERGGWVPKVDEDCRTSEPCLYAAGDCTGISGAAPALLQGRLAGLTAALDDDRMAPEAFAQETSALRRKLQRARTFGAASARLMTPSPGLLDTVTPDTVVCRCEDVTRREIEAAFEAGAADLNQVKAWTRCGMGPCQGRMCGDTAAALAALRLGGREAVGPWTARTPIRPVPMETLIGEYDYEDIPKPAPARR